MMKKLFHRDMKLGATPLPKKGFSFLVWAPLQEKLFLNLYTNRHKSTHLMNRDSQGYHSISIPHAKTGDCYDYSIKELNVSIPDPASAYQPTGVHGQSQIVNHESFTWTDRGWRGIEMKNAIFYECHIGLFTKQGTFKAAIKKIPYLKDLGVNVLEIMPVNQFPGNRNWGYDGVGWFAVQNSYGKPDDFKALINACHKNGIAVCLDVVYNHFGPEGNYWNFLGPYTHKKHRTPWGEAVNFDGRYSDDVRFFVLKNVDMWLDVYRIDALRLDAVHSIYDTSSKHILKEIKRVALNVSKKADCCKLIVAESEDNDRRLVGCNPGEYALDAVWSDDFHHSAHQLATSEVCGYYRDYNGLKDFAEALSRGFVYRGERFSKFRKKKYGTNPSGLNRESFLINLQNHDQIGNRPEGDRLSCLLSEKEYIFFSAFLILSPNTPLIFMGQEFYSKKPFMYFVNHSDKHLIEAVRDGRRNEFKHYEGIFVDDPNDLQTMEKCRMSWMEPIRSDSSRVLKVYKELLKIRSSTRFKKMLRIAPQIRVDRKKEKYICITWRSSGAQHVHFLGLFNKVEAKTLKEYSGYSKKVICSNSIILTKLMQNKKTSKSLNGIEIDRFSYIMFESKKDWNDASSVIV